MNFLTILLVVVAGLLGVGQAVTKSFMYPHGRGVPDKMLPPQDDVSSPEIFLRVPIIFYDEEYRSIYINSNGILSFLTEISIFFNIQFPLDYPVIAPFYSNVDIRGSGSVYYRETQEPEVLERTTDAVRKAFSDARDFQARSVLIATWEDVGYHKQGRDKVNTYQVAIISDGQDSYAELIYPEDGIQWTRGTASSSGLPDAVAQAGFISGDGRMQTLKGSGTDQVLNLNQWSNMGNPGQWLFRIGRLGADGNAKSPDAVAEEDEEPKTCERGKYLCHSRAICNDYSERFCCACQPGFYGNGFNCLSEEQPVRVNGKVSGVINGINFTDFDLQAYVVPKDGRSYTALSRVPTTVGYDMQSLNVLGTTIGWLFAKPMKGAQNGYQITGGVFNQTATITYPQTGHQIVLRQKFTGLDVFQQLQMTAEIKGDVPNIPIGSKITIKDYEEQYAKLGPGSLLAVSTLIFQLEGVMIDNTYKVEQNIEYSECEGSQGEDTPFRLRVARNYIGYEEENIIRYAMNSKVTPIGVEEDPCREGKSQCGSHSTCLAEGDSFRCVCNPGYQYIVGESGGVCVDADECATGVHNCDSNALCVNNQGSFYCRCNPGFVGDGTVCTREMTCRDLRCDYNAECLERYRGAPQCFCKPGFEGNGTYCMRIEDARPQEYPDYLPPPTEMDRPPYDADRRPEEGRSPYDMDHRPEDGRPPYDPDRRPEEGRSPYDMDRRPEEGRSPYDMDRRPEDGRPPYDPDRRPEEGRSPYDMDRRQEEGRSPYDPDRRPEEGRSPYDADRRQEEGRSPYDMDRRQEEGRSPYDSDRRPEEGRAPYDPDRRPEEGRPEEEPDVIPRCILAICYCPDGYEIDDSARRCLKKMGGQAAEEGDGQDRGRSEDRDQDWGDHQRQPQHPHQPQPIPLDADRRQLHEYSDKEENVGIPVPIPGCLEPMKCTCPRGYRYDQLSNHCYIRKSLNKSDFKTKGPSGFPIPCNVLNRCHPHAQCVPSSQTGTYHCECNVGYQGDGIECNHVDGFFRYEQDECLSSIDCVGEGECIFDPTVQKNTCICNEGFAKDPITKTCVEEAMEEHRYSRYCMEHKECHQDAECMFNDPRSQHGECTCRQGYEGDGRDCRPADVGCNVLNNCAVGSAECSYDGNAGGYRCRCRPGYEGDGITCNALRTCADDPSLCGEHSECLPSQLGGYSCQCRPGYIGNGLMCKPASDKIGNFLLLNQGNAMLRVPFKPTSGDPAKPIMMQVLQQSIGIDIDCNEGRVYWSDIAGKKIESANYKGGDVKKFVTEDIGSVEGVSVDWLSRNIFWTDSAKDTIEVANLDNSNLRKVLISDGLVNPRGVAVHPSRGKVFWSDWNREAPKIEWANMDGTGRSVFRQGPTVQLPNSLAIDFETDELCWADAGTKTIECTGIGNRYDRTVAKNLSYPFGLAISPDHYYWTDWTTRKIERVTRPGQAMEKPLAVPIVGSSKLYGIVAVLDTCPRISNVCQHDNGRCPENRLCLPDGTGGRSCVCATGAC